MGEIIPFKKEITTEQKLDGITNIIFNHCKRPNEIIMVMEEEIPFSCYLLDKIRHMYAIGTESLVDGVIQEIFYKLLKSEKITIDEIPKNMEFLSDQLEVAEKALYDNYEDVVMNSEAYELLLSVLDEDREEAGVNGNEEKLNEIQTLIKDLIQLREDFVIGFNGDVNKENEDTET